MNARVPGEQVSRGPDPAGPRDALTDISKWKPHRGEAKRALYLDCEGNRDRPPTLVGILAGGHFTVHVVERLFWPMVNLGGGPDHIRVKKAKIDSLLKRLREDDTTALPIVAYSEHDLNVIRDASRSRINRAWLAHNYRNGKRTLEKMFREQTKGLAGSAPSSLEEWMQRCHLERPEAYGVNRTGASLRDLREKLERGVAPVDLRPSLQERWFNVLGHNQSDCVALRDLVIKATQHRL